MANATITNQSYTQDLRKMAAIGLVTLLVTMLLVFFLLPFAYGTVTAFKTKEQIVNGSILPMSPVIATIGEETYDVYEVPMDDGSIKNLALISSNRNRAAFFALDNPGEEIIWEGRVRRLDLAEMESIDVDGVTYEVYDVPMPDESVQQLALIGERPISTFIDPENPTVEIQWEGRYQQLNQVMEFDPHPENFPFVWDAVNLPRLFRNTLTIALVGDLGTLISCSLVAYAFARFPIPGKNILFLLLISTIALPTQVTLVPTYAFFAWIGWTGTWLPLIVPNFFANAYNVFLLRQYFMQLPKEMDEAAMIDGANPFLVFVRIIIPQSWPALVAIFLFHFVFAWNDYFMPLIYLLGNPELHPISVGIQSFNFIYDQQPQYIQAVSLLALILPVGLFFISQRFFMQGVVITGVDK